MDETQTRSLAGGRTYWQLVGQGDPYRLLFPLGAFLGICGASAWPLHVSGVLPLYPNALHARIMVEGFLGPFFLGFVATALPRLLGAPKMTGRQAAVFALGLASSAALHFAGRMLWGDLVFFAVLCGFAVWLGSRAKVREDLPPPGFVLVGFGLLSGLLGALSQIADTLWPGLLPPWLWSVGRSLLYQGFLLFPVMGVGPFLLPRFFERPSKHDLPESKSVTPAWRSRALRALAAGVAVVCGFVLGGLGDERAGFAVRATVVALYFATEIPFNFSAKGSLALGVRLALASLPLGFAFGALSSGYLIASLHVVFITGFGLLVFMVGCRVVFGHGGQSEKFHARLWPVLAIIGLVVLAMLTRVSADLLPGSRMHHYAYAALAWVAASVVWFAVVARGLRRGD